MEFKNWLNELDQLMDVARRTTKHEPFNSKLIKQAIEYKNVPEINYLQYLFGFDQVRPNATLLDYVKAIDTYENYVRNKQFLNKPFPKDLYLLGKMDRDVKNALSVHRVFSKITEMIAYHKKYSNIY